MEQSTIICQVIPVTRIIDFKCLAHFASTFAQKAELLSVCLLQDLKEQGEQKEKEERKDSGNYQTFWLISIWKWSHHFLEPWRTSYSHSSLSFEFLTIIYMIN